jgi:hypothetical protein
MKTLLKRLKEPSTYSGLSGVALAAGISTDGFEVIAGSIAGVFATISILLGEEG